MSQKPQQDGMPNAEAVDLPEISVEHSTEFLTGSAPCAGVSRPLPAAWLGQRGIYRSRFEAVCNGEQLVEPLTLGELIQRAWPSPSTELAERGTQHRFSTTEQTCRHDFAGVWWNDNGETKTGRECRHCGFFVADVIKVQAERPEVVAWRYGFSGGIVSDKACLDEWKSGGEYQSLMTVAQHERIVEARWNRAMDLMGEHVARISEKFKAERDAALARVVELEKQEPVAWVDVDWIAQVSDPRGDGCTVRRAYGSAGVGLVPLYAAPVAQAQQLHDLDKQCRDDVARALGLRPSKERGFAWSYLLASIKSCVKASEDTAQAQHSAGYAEARMCANCRHIGINDAGADGNCPECGGFYELEAQANVPSQAQHSVPEGWMLVECGIWTQEQVDEMQKTVARFRNSEFVDDRALAMAVADAGQCKAPEISLAELLADAPGTEVPQAWLDVQSERRRQITAEGWTPEHDDEHACDEIAAFACFYAMPPAARDWDASSTGYGDTLGEAILPEGWEPKTGDRRRELVKAGALILAEIERLDRAAASQGGPSDA
ncbi:hypothetical protein [Pseudomonas aeruginosa]|uniref:hypothetical protein n=1 Tax=Pseudomonas aeruginosa TaxID=287 RepID=UPI0018C60401|nr:hypothetical protein [Pseudomonas aeruginosa]HCK4405282.1 hypothetical protein [Pseudomonas aeruginosa]